MFGPFSGGGRFGFGIALEAYRLQPHQSPECAFRLPRHSDRLGSAFQLHWQIVVQLVDQAQAFAGVIVGRDISGGQACLRQTYGTETGNRGNRGLHPLVAALRRLVGLERQGRGEGVHEKEVSVSGAGDIVLQGRAV